PTNVIVNGLPRVFFFYDQAHSRAIIDLSLLAQKDLPSDTYALVVDDKIRDLAGNRLDGEFRGIFPSGNGGAGGSFIQVLTGLQLMAPQIASVSLDKASDTGIPGDQNTNQVRPKFVGKVNNAFPGTVGGVTIVAEFNSLPSHDGTLDLRPGPADPADPL